MPKTWHPFTFMSGQWKTDLVSHHLSSFSSSGSEVTCSSALKYPSCSTEASNERDPLVQPETEKEIV